MELPSAVLKKIRSDDLRDEAVAETSESHTVIVEVELPTPALQVTRPVQRGSMERPQFRFEALQDSAAEVDGRVEALKKAITGVLGKPPETFLATSSSFIVEANGEQIGRLAGMSGVAAIWPNTRRGF